MPNVNYIAMFGIMLTLKLLMLSVSNSSALFVQSLNEYHTGSLYMDSSSFIAADC